MASRSARRERVQHDEAGGALESARDVAGKRRDPFDARRPRNRLRDMPASAMMRSRPPGNRRNVECGATESPWPCAAYAASTTRMSAASLARGAARTTSAAVNTSSVSCRHGAAPGTASTTARRGVTDRPRGAASQRRRAACVGTLARPARRAQVGRAPTRRNRWCRDSARRGRGARRRRWRPARSVAADASTAISAAPDDPPARIPSVATSRRHPTTHSRSETRTHRTAIPSR